MIRDPRDVVASLCAAGKGFGARWAPRGIAAAANRWRHFVRRGLEIAEAAPDRYREVRYERLHAEGAAELERIFAWLGLPVDPGFCARAVEVCSFATLPERLPRPEGFFRRGVAGGWRGDLSRRQVRLIEHLAEDLLLRLGYERTIGRRRVRPARIWLRRGLSASVEAVKWLAARLEALVERV